MQWLALLTVVAAEGAEAGGASSGPFGGPSGGQSSKAWKAWKDWDGITGLFRKGGEASAGAAGACVILCDAPAYSLSMDVFEDLIVPECLGKGRKFIFVDPGFQPGRRANEFRVQAYFDAKDVPRHVEADFANSLTGASVRNAWVRWGLADFVGLGMAANSTLLSGVVAAEGGQDPAYIIDTGCPGTNAVAALTGSHAASMKEDVLYREVAALMGPRTEFVTPDWDAGAELRHLSKADIEEIARKQAALVAGFPALAPGGKVVRKPAESPSGGSSPGSAGKEAAAAAASSSALVEVRPGGASRRAAA